MKFRDTEKLLKDDRKMFFRFFYLLSWNKGNGDDFGNYKIFIMTLKHYNL